MSKEIKSNTFGKGLMMDLHPISTPNTVLTDNLNGTFITYDGNEHVLQNEMGNYKLQDCQLKSNYIPIGLKEYAGILYIVSYNPLDEHVEIGTYPSPEIKTPSTYNGVQKELQTYGELKGEFLYSELEKLQSTIWYDEKLKIHPGDYYKITTEEFDDSRIIKNAWFVMTDDKTLQEIEIQQNTNDYVPVTWEYPGYLVFQQKIITPTEFNAFISQLNLPNYVESEDACLPDITDGKIGFEITLSKIDYNRLISGQTLNDAITVNVSVSKIDQDGNEEVLDINWKNGEEVFTVYDFGESEVNVFGLLDLDSHISGLKKTDTLVFNITPVFKENEFSVIYDHYKTTVTTTLNKIGTIGDLKIGSEVYKFWRKNDVCYLIFNISSPTIVVGDIHLYYRLVDLDGNVALDWTYYEDEVLSGENMITISLTEEQKEQIYILEFCCGDENGPNPEVFNQLKFKKLLITSIVFNEFVGTKTIFDQEISFPEWYRLHDKYINFNSEDLEINIPVEDYTFTTTKEKEIVKVTNQRYWDTTVDDCQDFSYTMAIKEGEQNPKLDYSYGYLQENMSVNGSVQKLNENLLNMGIWKIPEKDVFIKVGDTQVVCNQDGTFTSNSISGVLAKNVVINTVSAGSTSIPSVDKIFINRNLEIEKTENGITTVLKDQQLVGHQYGAGGANSSEDRRQYNWAAENLITSITTLASKLSVIMSVVERVSNYTTLGLVTGTATAALTGVILLIASSALIPGAAIIALAVATIAAIVAGIMIVANAVMTVFHTEQHLTWASGLYSSDVETIEDIIGQFDETENGSYEPNEKFKENLSLTMIDREQGIQWKKGTNTPTGLQNIVNSFLQKNQSATVTHNNITMESVVKNKTQYSCFPVLFQNYVTENNGLISRDGICIQGENGYFVEQDEFDTHYSVWIAFMTNTNQNSLVYVPCTFDGMVNKITKTGSISNSVNDETGAPTSSNGVVAENNTQTIVDVAKMVVSGMVWCRNLFVIPKEGELISGNFVVPVFPDIPDNVSLVFEYECRYDYSKTCYLGKHLPDNNRISLYNLTDKVENLTLMNGASVVLENKIISDKQKVDVLSVISNDVLNSITERINSKLSKYKEFGSYCEEQINCSKIDPVIRENDIRNGKMKGVYNTIDSYDAAGGLLYQLNQLSNLEGTLTYPTTDKPLRYYLSKRNKKDIYDLYVTLGYDSKLTLDCSKIYFDLSSQ